MNRRPSIAILALTGCLTVLVLTACGGPTTPVGGTAAPQATDIAEHRAYEATLEARERAAAQAAPAPDPRDRPSIPASCPRARPAQSSIPPLSTQDPSARGLRISTQASVVVGPDEYFLSSGALRDNPQQGAIVVTHFATDPCAPGSAGTTAGQFPMPTAHGAITLTAVQGEVSDFTAADGTIGRFNVVTKQFMERDFRSSRSGEESGRPLVCRPCSRVAGDTAGVFALRIGEPTGKNRAWQPFFLPPHNGLSCGRVKVEVSGGASRVGTAYRGVRGLAGGELCAGIASRSSLLRRS